LTAGIKSHTAPNPPFRAGTKVSETPAYLIFNCGGIGDYVNWVTAIKYVIHSNPHLTGLVVVPPFFADLAKVLFRDLPARYTLYVSSNLETDERLKTDEALILCPDRKQFANACGFSLFHLGFIYFNQSVIIPAGWNELPRIEGDEVSIDHLNLPENYAVITTGGTAANRTLPPSVINEIINYCLSEGITPLFLGKEDIAPDHKAKHPEGVHYEKGVDLREKTKLDEAAMILARAKFVCGLDNGLLHIAAMSSTPIVAAFTSVNPILRVPPRRKGAVTAVLTPPESLQCRFCNSNMRYIANHDFKDCIYKDNLCITQFTGDDFIKAIKSLGEP